MFFFLCVYVRSLKKARIKEHRGVWRWGCFVKSMNAWNIAVVHLKENASSIKQTWRTGPIHQSAARISYWVQLRRDKCRTSSVCPRLPIDRDHHCDVAFYLTTCSLKLYIIPNTEISKEEEGWEGHEPDCIFYSQNVWALFVQDCFHGFWWSASSRCREVLRLFYWGFVPAAAVCFVLGLFLGRWISVWLTRRCPLRDWIVSTRACSPLSGTYSNVSNPAERKASWVAIDPCHYGIPCQ